MKRHLLVLIYILGQICGCKHSSNPSGGASRTSASESVSNNHSSSALSVDVEKNPSFTPSFGANLLPDEVLRKNLMIALSANSPFTIEILNCPHKKGRLEFSVDDTGGVDSFMVFDPATGKQLVAINNGRIDRQIFDEETGRSYLFQQLLLIHSNDDLLTNSGRGLGALVLKKSRPYSDVYALIGFVVARPGDWVDGNGPGLHPVGPYFEGQPDSAAVLSTATILGEMKNPRFFIKGRDTCYETPGSLPNSRQ